MSDEGNSEDLTSFEYTDAALPLLYYNAEEKKYDLSATAASMIRSLKGKLSVITVAGLYRTGKSYLLNQVLLGRKNGFGVGPSINPCTKGMWIWGRPIQGTTTTGEPCNILLIDTEGIGALDEDSTHDSRIFSLAILFSSCFIYNSVGSIDESALQCMSLVLNLAKIITVKSDNCGQENLSMYFPSFLWVVRDFALQLVDENGTQLTSNQYLERALMPQKGSSEACEEKNRIRSMIKSFFKDRQCFTLVRPTTNEAELQNLDQKDLDTLRPEFIAQAKDLRNHIFSSIKPKEINGKNLTSDMFFEMIESYVEAINNGTAPCIESTWSYLCKNQVMKAIKEAEEVYEREISEYLEEEFPVSEKILVDIHNKCKKLSIGDFKSKAMGEELEVGLKKIKAKIQEKYESVFFNNHDACKACSSNFLQENYSYVLQKIKKGVIKNFLEYEKEMRILKEYAKSHCKVINFEILSEFLMESICSTGEYFVKNISNELSLQKDMNRESLLRLETELKENRDNFYKERENRKKREF